MVVFFRNMFNNKAEHAILRATQLHADWNGRCVTTKIDEEPIGHPSILFFRSSI